MEISIQLSISNPIPTQFHILFFQMKFDFELKLNLNLNLKLKLELELKWKSKLNLKLKLIAMALQTPARRPAPVLCEDFKLRNGASR